MASARKVPMDIMPNDLTPMQQLFGVGDGQVMPVQVQDQPEYPELKIFRSMIEDACLEARNNPDEPGISKERAARRFWEQRRALGWIFTGGEDYFSFEFCCEWANMDPNRIRRMLISEIPAAFDICEHLKNPDRVPPPEIPKEYLLRAPAHGERQPAKKTLL